LKEEMSQAPKRWNRDYLFDILKELGIRYIFGVPGTNEIPLIDGTSYPENGVKYIECLYENIAVGAAMGSARMTNKPGVLILHVTPGISHGIGNLFNAARSRTPLVILCCQQQNELVTQEPLLTSNLVELARQYTKWAHEVRAPEEMALVLQRAFKEAMAPPNGPVFISIPWEFTMRSIGSNERVKGVTSISSRFTGDPSAIERAASLLSRAQNPIIVAGDAVGAADAWAELRELAELTGAPVLLQSWSSTANFPNDDVHWQGELPGSQSGMQKVFKGHDVAFLCGFGAQAQVTVFKYSDGSLIPPEVTQIFLTNNTWDIGKNSFGFAVFGDVKATLPLINKLIREDPNPGAPQRNEKLKQMAAQRRAQWDAYLQTAMAQKEIWGVVIAQALRETIQELDLSRKFVYVHEAVSDSAPFQYLLPLGTADAAPISYYAVAGGSLGWSLPATLGIKLEANGWQGIKTDLVVAATGDGSSLFCPQTWWTAAHRGIAVLYIITNNSEYHTLQLGLQQVVTAYGDAPGYQWKPKDNDQNPEYLRIERPKLDFVAIAKAFGGHEGEIVMNPADVKAAVRRGAEYVIREGKSYILDMRTAQQPVTPPTTTGMAAQRQATLKQARARYAVQPPLDVFHRGPHATASVDEASDSSITQHLAIIS
jgi:benzoylformate decarboxylase